MLKMPETVFAAPPVPPLPGDPSPVSPPFPPIPPELEIEIPTALSPVVVTVQELPESEPVTWAWPPLPPAPALPPLPDAEDPPSPPSPPVLTMTRPEDVELMEEAPY